jgi:two-component system, chemotaxis family, response regulator Rcp1
LLDLNLPRIDGKHLLSRIRESKMLADTPVIVMTSSESEHDKRTALSLGATRYFCKPVDLYSFMELGKVVEDTLKNRSESRQ